MKTEKFKVTPLERAWILYDVGNSAFVLMIATLVPIFFNALAEAGGVSKVDYLAYWGYASSIVTVVTAILGPILGTLADTKGFKKPIFMLCLFVGVIGCCAMGLAGTWLAFLVIFIIAKIGYSGSLVFYDSMLGDVTTPERMDMVSSRGYAWGYIGSCVPFVVCLALVLGSSAVGLSQMTALSIALVITAVWWLVVTLPLLKKYNAEKAILFGSYARQEADVTSDIDLIIAGGTQFDPTDVLCIAEELHRTLQKPVDVYELREITPGSAFYRTIQEEGVQIA